MRDPYLEAMLKGDGGKKKEKDRFEIALDKSIQQFLDTLSFDDEPGQFLSSKAKREKFEQELKESLAHSDLNHYLVTAVQVIRRDGKQYLDKEVYSTVLEEFANAGKILETMDLEASPTEDFGQILHMSGETINSIFNIATAKFQEEIHAECLSLFVLLTVLQPKEFDLWYRTGIAAQACENYSLALNAYTIAADLNPELIEAHLFSIECYLKLDMAEEAKEEFAETEKLVALLPPSDDRHSLLAYTKGLLGS
jgi:tetratricopeptide (TPR) repeat protein